VFGKSSAKSAAKKTEKPFWETKTLGQMNKQEWESLCDGCAKCCLNKLENESTGEIQYTDVACRLLDTEKCHCVSYDDRKRYVPDCQILNTNSIKRLVWLPSTCAYRLIDESKPLYWWHHLICGDKNTVHDVGVSVRGRVVSERDTDDLENRIVGWPK